jgi:phosphopantothenoylcysteine decarboxylase/phosphopantothenate--cysteine ligase
MDALAGKRIVLGVTGGVAAYKTAELSRLLIKAGVSVDVVLTQAGSQFVGSATFQALTGRPVWQGLWDERMSSGMAHIDLTRGAAAILVAPATADFLAKLAHGAADDLLSTLCLARDCPLLVAPAMNRQMWENPATQRNIALLKEDGIQIVGPGSGAQACGEVGEGRMLEAADLLAALSAFLQPKRLLGRRVLLTAGPTFEPIDPVRGITNSSSGKMGFALAQACADAGAEVTLVAGPVALPSPWGVKRLDVQTSAQMHEAVMSQLPGQDVFIGVAAVADYRPVKPATHKIKKSREPLTLLMEATTDILGEVAAMPNAPLCVGFAAESQNLAEYAEAKRKSKKLALVVGNLVQDGLGGETNCVTLFDATGAHPLPAAKKIDVARGIVVHLAGLMALIEKGNGEKSHVQG